jgi:hypothetical protein
VAALLALGKGHILRQRLREWLYDGANKAAPCATHLEVHRCFASLMRWVLAVAMVWGLAYGPRVEKAIPAALSRAKRPPPCPRPARRRCRGGSVLRLGVSWVRRHLARGQTSTISTQP